MDLYKSHPVSGRTILRRIEKTKGSISQLTELDLAYDEATELTDQNHPGGAPFVLALASLAGITLEARVLDLGSGLGGSARMLAHNIGCSVNGIDLSWERTVAGRELTELVSLGHLVTLTCSDFMSDNLPAELFDVAWGQGAWIHVVEKDELVRLCRAWLRRGGRMACEDAFLLPGAAVADNDASLAALTNTWKACWTSIDSWLERIERHSFSVETCQDMSAAFVEYYRRLSRIGAARADLYPPGGEVEAWEHASRLATDGVIGYFRIVARKR